MIEMLAAPEDVLAVTVSGTITGADMDQLMSRLEAMLAGDGKVHMFVETRGISGMEMHGFPAQVTRAMPLFGKLARFGRIAVVADQAWVRMWSRLESAMLPFVSYRVFEPEGREEALAWAKGETPAA